MGLELQNDVPFLQTGTKDTCLPDRDSLMNINEYRQYRNHCKNGIRHCTSRQR